jgi:hypothetical protein
MTLGQFLHENPAYLMAFLIVANPLLGIGLGFISATLTQSLRPKSPAMAAIAGFALGLFYIVYTWSTSDLSLLVIAARLSAAAVISPLFAYHYSLHVNRNHSEKQ